MKNFKIKTLLLNLFDEGAPTGEMAMTESSQPSETGETEKVVYGKQPTEEVPVTEEQKEPTPEERRKAYDEYINGEGKEFYTQDTQRMINHRFKATKGLEEENAAIRKAVEPLMSKYGIEDISKLATAIENDEDTYRERADKLGLSIEQMKERDNLIRENEESKRIKERQDQEEYANRQYNEWMESAKKVQEVYPEFNVRAELRNDEFVKMIVGGIDMRKAYEVVHLDDIKSKTAAEVSKATSDNIKARGKRPSENGTSNGSGVIVKSDPSVLTDEDISEIIKRVKEGEKISF